ncbi:unnamed protein product [Cuscuta campestris]|uniref:Uncharacterized protein n=1 Tax=Cuscuta campestris TaxID=132261 RepID=A0A484M4R9_9ASTE|nr:unnamed protein product [Cuscuta campestris]
MEARLARAWGSAGPAAVTAVWRGSGRHGVVRPLGEGLGADRPKLRDLCERANSGGYLEPFKDVHHHERIEVLTGHDRVPMLPGLDYLGHDVEKEPALWGRGVDGGATRGMADELGDAKLVEDKALVVEHPVLSAIVGDVVALVGEAGDAPKLLNGKLNRRALDKRVEHVVLTPEVGVEGPDQCRVDLLPSPGDERPKAGLMKLRVYIVVALQLREELRDNPRGSHNPFREEGEETGALLLGIEPEIRSVAIVEALLGVC